MLPARFKALADPGRLRMLSMITASETAEACVCDLTERGVRAYYSLVLGALSSLAALPGPPRTRELPVPVLHGG